MVTKIEERFSVQANDPVDKLIASLVLYHRFQQSEAKALLASVSLTDNELMTWSLENRLKVNLFVNMLAVRHMFPVNSLFTGATEIVEKLIKSEEPISQESLSWYKAIIMDLYRPIDLKVNPCDFDGSDWLKWNFSQGARPTGDWSDVPLIAC